MPRKLKFEEESKILTIRVPKSLYEDLKSEFEWVISYRIQNKKLPSYLGHLNSLLQDELKELQKENKTLEERLRAG